MRPDFDGSKHAACRQNGFNLKNMDAIDEEDENDQDEEVKRAIDSDDEQMAGSMINTTVTS